MLSSYLALGLFTATAFRHTQAIGQTPLDFGLKSESYDDSNLFSPFEDLAALSSTEFTTLGHPVFPNYQVRLKKSKFCDGGVDAYTGYIDIEARHLFFYFFESRDDPDKDDVIFWTNGGPGGSSSFGLLMEQGPCLVTSANTTKYNPFSWNSKANMFFIDQPIGVGFSYADYGEYVSTTEEAAKDIASFVAIFFEHFSKFKGRPFHMSGESYGGRYIPSFAAAVYDQNARLTQAGLTPINLSSIMIGNGMSDLRSLTLSYYEMQCQSTRTSQPILDIATCVQMKRILPRCEKMFTASCIDTLDAIDCASALSFCESAIVEPFFETGYNPYDISKKCEGEYQDTICYPITKTIEAYLSQPKLQQALGIDAKVSGNFSGISYKVNSDFSNPSERVFPTTIYISALLERGVKVLIYVGTNDWICNWIGNERMTLSLEWTGKEAFNAEPLKEWKVDEKVAGMTRSFGNLSFVTILGAGHMVPYDQPEVSLEVLKRWLSSGKF
ncbi:Carboxypeptidase [Abortiporus biennis]